MGKLDLLKYGFCLGLGYFLACRDHNLSSYSDRELFVELVSRYNNLVYYAMFLASFLFFLALIGFLTVMRFFLARFKRGASYVCNELSADLLPPCVESFRQGSEYFSGALPKHQVQIAIKNLGKYTISGQGFRFRNLLITARHVIEDHPSIRLLSAKGDIDVSTDDVVVFNEDLALLNLSSSQWSVLGISSCTLPKAALSTPVSVSVSGPDNKKSMGLLETSKTFGFVEYHGSTSAGFSGAPYGVGNCVMGMHLGAGTSNFGIDANFILALVTSQSNLESSDSWAIAEILKMAKQNRKVFAHQSPFNPEEVKVKVNGRYFVFDMNENEQLYEALDFSDEKDVRYDHESLTSATIAEGPFLDASVAPLLQGEEHVSRSRVKRFVKGSTNLVPRVSDGQTQTSARQRGVSQSIVPLRRRRSPSIIRLKK